MGGIPTNYKTEVLTTGKDGKDQIVPGLFAAGREGKHSLLEGLFFIEENVQTEKSCY